VENEAVPVVLAEGVDASVDFPFFAFKVEVMICWELGGKHGYVVVFSENVNPVVFKHVSGVEYA